LFRQCDCTDGLLQVAEAASEHNGRESEQDVDIRWD